MQLIYPKSQQVAIFFIQLVGMFERFDAGEISRIEAIHTQNKKQATHRGNKQHTHERGNNKPMDRKSNTSLNQSCYRHAFHMQGDVSESRCSIG